MTVGERVVRCIIEKYANIRKICAHGKSTEKKKLETEMEISMNEV